MSHINSPDKTKGQWSFDLQFFPQQGKDEDTLKLISSSTISASRQMIKSQKKSFQPLIFSLRFQKIEPAPENEDVSNLICCL